MSRRVVKTPDIRREEIVTAARELFAERGVRATTFQDVAERVGVTRGLVYHYAGDMGTLVDQVLETCIAEFVADLRAWDEAREVGNIDQAVIDCIGLFRRHATDRPGDAVGSGPDAVGHHRRTRPDAVGHHRRTRPDAVGHHRRTARRAPAPQVRRRRALRAVPRPGGRRAHRHPRGHHDPGVRPAAHDRDPRTCARRSTCSSTGCVALVRSHPDASDDVLGDLVRQTLRLAPNDPDVTPRRRTAPLEGE